MESSSTLNPATARRRIINFEDREQLAFLALQEIKAKPGATTEEIAAELNITDDECRSILIRNLKGKGKIRNLGWVAEGYSSGDELNADNEHSSGDELTSKKHSSGDELKVRWKKPGGSAKTNHKYPWLCQGDRELIYIGGGNEKNLTSRARVSQIELWIRTGIPTDEIVRRVQELKHGQTVK